MTERHKGSTIDAFLREEGVLEEIEARAVKEVIAWQIAEAMKDPGDGRPSQSVRIRYGRAPGLFRPRNFPG